MLELKHVNKTFYPNSPNENHVIRDLSLSVRAGEFVTVIGSNGSGKSTLQNLISGTLLPDSGEISLAGQDVTFWPDYRRAKFLGRVFQDPMLGTASDMHVVENLAMAKRRGKRRGLAWGTSKEEESYYRDLLADLGLGLENRLFQKVKRLSGGQRQAITLLMACMQKPDLLLLDEHTAALDPKTAQIVLDLTDRLIKDQGLTSLMITHNMRDAIKYGSRLIMLDKGQVIYDISGQAKANLTVAEILKLFEEVGGQDFVASDKLLLG